MNKRRKSNPVAKNMEKFNKPKTMLHRKDKQRSGHDKYPKRTIEQAMEED
jgi:hypothetical protein